MSHHHPLQLTETTPLGIVGGCNRLSPCWRPLCLAQQNEAREPDRFDSLTVWPQKKVDGLGDSTW